MAGLLPLDEAQARLLTLAEPLEAEAVPIDAAVGRWVAETVYALRDQPSVDLSAMDGYAIRAGDSARALNVIGTSYAGNGFSGTVAKGEAVRIFTGAPVPEGADTVVIQEDCNREGERLLVNQPSIAPGKNIRRRAGDFPEQAILAEEGIRLSAARAALIAMGGHGKVNVHRRARVVLISTGDELLPPGSPLGPHQIPASNGAMLKALLESAGADVEDLGIIADDLDAISSAVSRSKDHDLIVTIGGASVGDMDFVQPALVKAGAKLEFIKAAIKPGKPIMAGRLQSAVVLGLPGNPVSAYVTGLLFALPLARALMGAALPLPNYASARIIEPLPPSGGRTEFLRALVEGDCVIPLVNQDSAALMSLANADALIRRDAGSGALAAGSRVEILRLD